MSSAWSGVLVREQMRYFGTVVSENSDSVRILSGSNDGVWVGVEGGGGRGDLIATRIPESLRIRHLQLNISHRSSRAA